MKHTAATRDLEHLDLGIGGMGSDHCRHRVEAAVLAVPGAAAKWRGILPRLVVRHLENEPQ